MRRGLLQGRNGRFARGRWDVGVGAKPEYDTVVERVFFAYTTMIPVESG